VAVDRGRVKGAHPAAPAPVRPAVHLAASADVEGVTGRCFIDGQPAPPAPQALDDADAARPWDVSAPLVGLD
jgi:hypothetical protein